VSSIRFGSGSKSTANTKQSTAGSLAARGPSAAPPPDDKPGKSASAKAATEAKQKDAGASTADQAKQTKTDTPAGKGDAKPAAGSTDTKPGGGAKQTARTTSTKVAKDSEPRRPAVSKSALKGGADAIRNRIAAVVWLVAVLAAVVLASGALLVALDANQDNAIVDFVRNLARDIDGPFWNVFTFEGDNAKTKELLVNWGLAAVAYLVAGKILDRIIRP
jgi:hypothetical protein